MTDPLDLLERALRATLEETREFRKAANLWQWCLDCGTSEQDCKAGGKCCPACRHRKLPPGIVDIGQVAAVAFGPPMAPITPQELLRALRPDQAG